MSYEISVVDDSEISRRIRLAGELCILHAAELKPRLLEYLEPERALEVDLAGVDEVDTAGVQLLLFAKREALTTNCLLSFVNHSQAMLDIIDLFNLSRDFGDPLLISASAEETAHES